MAADGRIWAERVETLRRLGAALDRLRLDELLTLVWGIELGYLVSEHPSSALIETFGTMALLERRVSILIAPRGGTTKLLVLLDDPASLPDCIQILCDAAV
jgi:hypothetical protein